MQRRETSTQSSSEASTKGAVPIEEEAAVVAAAAGGKPAVAAVRPMAPADDRNTAHLRQLNWALLAIIVALVGDILAAD